jgi:hypothetical protein
MKKINISPEWVLDKLTSAYSVNGEGDVRITADTISVSRWIDLALETLGIKYETHTVDKDPEPEEQYFKVQWEFKIEDIKAECPNLYNKWIIMDAQAYRFWEVQRLIDSSKKKELR